MSAQHRFGYCTNAKTCFNVHFRPVLAERRVLLGIDPTTLNNIDICNIVHEPDPENVANGAAIPPVHFSESLHPGWDPRKI